MGVLLLVRHGQASFGADDYDVLSDLGARQAGVLGARLAPVAGSVQRVVAGGLRRQQDTARHALAAMGLPAERLETDRRWDEYDAVDVLTGIPQQEVTDNRSFQLVLDEGLRRWTGGAHDDEYAESWPAFRDRVEAALADVLAGPGTTLVVSSAGTVGTACGVLWGAPPEVGLAVSRVMVNASLTKVVRGRSGTSLVTVNDHAHLEAEPGLVTYR